MNGRADGKMSMIKEKIQFQLNGEYWFSEVETDEDRDEVYKLRFLVPCIDSGYTPNPKTETERDRFDDVSEHFLAYHKDKPIGTVRLIPDNPLNFPMENPDFVNGQKYEGFPLNEYKSRHDIERAAEIGRLVVINSERSFATLLGLFKCLYECNKRMKIQHVFCVAKKTYALLYAKIGFIQIGDPYPYPVRLDATRLDQPDILDFHPLHLDLKEAEKIARKEKSEGLYADQTLLEFLYGDWENSQSAKIFS